MSKKHNSSSDRIGQTVGNYKLLGLLGEGGMGVVYKAEHTMLGRRVALKMLLSEYAEQDDIVERFFTEAKAVNRIGHKNIIDVMDYGLTSDNCPYFIMELLEGTELAKILETTGALEIPRAIHIARQTASALEASHAAGILHRDLKPENIFIIQRDKEPDFVKVLDFGIAKLIEKKDDVTLTSKTKTGVVIGTPQYMAPEQVRRQPLDARTDLYALGLVFYEMVVGVQPFVAETFPDLVVKMLTEPLIKPTERNPLVPQPLEDVIVKMLERNKEDRYQSMADLINAIDEAQQQIANQATTPTIRPTAPSSSKEILKKENHVGPSGLRMTPAPSQTEKGSELANPEALRQRSPTTLSMSAIATTPLKKPSRPPILLGVAALLVGVGSVFFFTAQPTQQTQQSTATTPEPPPTPTTVALAFSSDISGVSLFEGNKNLGILPQTIQVDRASQHTYTFKKEGFEEKSKTFAANENQSFEIELKEVKTPTSEPVQPLVTNTTPEPDITKPDITKPDPKDKKLTKNNKPTDPPKEQPIVTNTPQPTVDPKPEPPKPEEPKPEDPKPKNPKTEPPETKPNSKLIGQDAESKCKLAIYANSPLCKKPE